MNLAIKRDRFWKELGMYLKMVSLLVMCACSIAHSATPTTSAIEEQEAYMRKMKALNEAAALKSKNTSTGQSAGKGAQKLLVLKPDAPAQVQHWFANREMYRQATIADAETAIAKATGEIDRQRQTITSIRREPVNQVDAGRDMLGHSRTADDPSDVAAKKERIRNCQDSINASADEIRTQKALIVKVKANPDKVYFGDFVFRPDAIGNLRADIEVLQIIDAGSFRGKLENDEFFVDGFDTSRFADGQHVSLADTIYCPGSRTYGTIVGSRRTLMVIERIDVGPWITASE